MEHAHQQLNRALDILDTRIAQLPIGVFLRDRNLKRINTLLNTTYAAVRSPQAFVPTHFKDLEHDVMHLSDLLARYIRRRINRPFEAMRKNSHLSPATAKETRDETHHQSTL